MILIYKVGTVLLIIIGLPFGNETWQLKILYELRL